MKVLGLKSVVSIGNSSFLVRKLSKNEISLESLKDRKITKFGLSDILENLRLGTLKVERV